MTEFIIYMPINGDGEVLVTTPELEKLFIKECWPFLVGRDIKEYTRWETKDMGIRITSNGLRVV